jgi:hypothetical protein
MSYYYKHGRVENPASADFNIDSAKNDDIVIVMKTVKNPDNEQLEMYISYISSHGMQLITTCNSGFAIKDCVLMSALNDSVDGVISDNISMKVKHCQLMY